MFDPLIKEILNLSHQQDAGSQTEQIGTLTLMGLSSPSREPKSSWPGDVSAAARRQPEDKHPARHRQSQFHRRCAAATIFKKAAQEVGGFM